MDNLTKKQRSFTMSRIKSKWTSPEVAVHNHLKGLKIEHKMHPKISGSPDVILKNKKKAVFIHGCFWHKCPICYKKPQSNVDFWRKKIRNNVLRDKKNERLLKRTGWSVVKIWEHEIKNDLQGSLLRIIN